MTGIMMAWSATQLTSAERAVVLAERPSRALRGFVSVVFMMGGGRWWASVSDQATAGCEL